MQTENPNTRPEENNASFLKRFYIYQKERFPFLAHGLLILSFSFSAVSYSRICRGAPGFISLKDFLAGVFITVTLFFLVRIYDEFKDKDDDARYRKYLPVPRGLIKLSELKVAGMVTVILQLIVIFAVFPKMFWLYAIVFGYLQLMGVEFFAPEWLRSRQSIYVISHMLIIPLVDTFASGLDWHLAGVSAPLGLVFFFGVSYMNGIVLEFGRKIRKPGKEEPGVITYSALYGADKATILWVIFLIATLVLSMVASYFADYPLYIYVILGGFFAVCTVPAFLFLKNPTEKSSKMIEYASALWTIAMYLTLGGAPMLAKLFLR